MSNVCAAVVYAEQLVGRGYGLPLWHPEPTQNFGEVEIGDVGYISEGTFIRLFNALRPAGDPANAGGVPEGFVMLKPNTSLLFSGEQHVSPGPICTTTTTYRKIGAEVEGSSIAGASYTFNCNSSRGAVAVLGDTGHQQWYLRNRSFREYIVKYHSSWYDFAVEKDHDISPDSLVLVSGWLKTSEWAIATFSNHGKAHDISLSACAGSYASAAFEISAGTEVQMSVEQRCGPPENSGAASPASGEERRRLPHNQCLFLRYYKLKTRALGRPKVSVQAEAKDVQSPWQETSQPPFSSNPNSTSGGSGSSSVSALSWLTQRFLGTGRATELPDEQQGLWEHADSSSVEDFALPQVEEMPQLGALVGRHDPIDCMLDYILQHSDAEVAVACHEDAYEIFPLDYWPKNPARYLNQTIPVVELTGREGRLRASSYPTLAYDEQSESPTSPQRPVAEGYDLNNLRSGDDTKGVRRRVDAELDSRWTTFFNSDQASVRQDELVQDGAYGDFAESAQHARQKFSVSQWVWEATASRPSSPSPIDIPVSHSRSSSLAAFSDGSYIFPNTSPLSPTSAHAAPQPIPRSFSLGEGDHASRICQSRPARLTSTSESQLPMRDSQLRTPLSATSSPIIPAPEEDSASATVRPRMTRHGSMAAMHGSLAAMHGNLAAMHGSMAVGSEPSPSSSVSSLSYMRSSMSQSHLRRAGSTSDYDNAAAHGRRRSLVLGDGRNQSTERTGTNEGRGALQEEDEELATLGAKTRLVSRRSPATPNPPLRLSKPAPSAWQLYFADWIQRHQASSSKKLSVAQAAKEASQEFARLTAEEKEPYRRRAQAAKEARERENTAYMQTLTPDDLKRENAFRTAQRKTGMSRRSYMKDPNAPKKPLSAYFMFLQRVRSEPALVDEAFGDETDTTKQSVLAAAKWRSMTDEERMPFLARAEQEKLEYEAARKRYEEGETGSQSITNFGILPSNPIDSLGFPSSLSHLVEQEQPSPASGRPARRRVHSHT